MWFNSSRRVPANIDYLLIFPFLWEFRKKYGYINRRVVIKSAMTMPVNIVPYKGIGDTVEISFISHYYEPYNTHVVIYQKAYRELVIISISCSCLYQQ